MFAIQEKVLWSVDCQPLAKLKKGHTQGPNKHDGFGIGTQLCKLFPSICTVDAPHKPTEY
jgi:hypothetical protein